MNGQKPNTPAQSAKTEPNKDAKAAYEAKQAKGVKESVKNCNAKTELAHTAEEIKAERENAANSKTGGQDYDHYNGMSQ